ncbi:Rossman fold protein, TIGR00730 family [Oceaniferula spumae]|uniref:AMP nucleosidase n=1 Tax=Oceaniferula spumae TaxID=2979115 RepID=A0AAT9FRQ1_9BACT
MPKDRDFTGGMIHSESCSYIGSTGEKKLDEQILKLANEVASSGKESCLLAEMMISAVRISRGAVTDGDFKTINRAVKEMRIANEVFYPYRDCRKVAVFGSARTDPEEPEYKAAVEFTEKMREAGFMTITGAGPGIMAAGNEGAGREDSFGLNINLPFEAAANAFIAGDEKLVDFNFFFTRKLSFVKESDAVAAFPGGFGTMDEIFETLTLIQTGKAAIYPLVLIDAKGGKYWKFWQQFVVEHLSRLKLISEDDFSLYKVTDDVDEAIEEITRFYSNFHSYRYCGDRLVIRMQEKLTEAKMKKIRKEFADIVKSGDFEQGGPLPAESGDEKIQDLPRLIFRHRRRNFGRLRQLIDMINE